MSKSPFKTAIAVANSLVTTSLFVSPVAFSKQGIIQNTLAAIIMAIVMGSTAIATGTLVSGKRKQFYRVVSNQLGPKWSRLMAFLGTISTNLQCCIIFIMSSTILYELFGVNLNINQEMGQKIFKSIVIILFLPFYLLSNLSLVVKFGVVSMVVMWVYLLTLVFSFIENIPHLDSNVIQDKPLTINTLQYWFAFQGFSFLCHPTLDVVLKQNKQSNKNGRVVAAGYIMGFFLMTGCGIIGGLAIYKRQAAETDDLIRYFKGTWQQIVLGISVFIYFLTIFPIFCVVARLQCFSILPQQYKTQPERTHKRLKLVFMVTFTTACLLFVWFETSPIIIMGFIGTIVCFYRCYLLPILMKLKLIRKANMIEQDQTKQLLEQLSTPYEDKALIPTQERNIRILYVFFYLMVLIFGALLIFGEIYFLINRMINDNM